MSRIDDVINTAGHRLSTDQMEEVLASHSDLAECAVVGVADEFKGQVPIGFAVLKTGVERTPEEVAAELVALVRERVGSVASFKTVAIVDALPKTRSGNTLRATIRNMPTAGLGAFPRRSRMRLSSMTSRNCCRHSAMEHADHATVNERTVRVLPIADIASGDFLSARRVRRLLL
jgi:hypothetical protein